MEGRVSTSSISGAISRSDYLQVVANYVAMTPDGRVVDSSLDRGRPYDLRIGAGQVKSYAHLGLLTTFRYSLDR